MAISIFKMTIRTKAKIDRPSAVSREGAGDVDYVRPLKMSEILLTGCKTKPKWIFFV